MHAEPFYQQWFVLVTHDMLFFFEEEQLDNGSATTSQKEFPKDGNRRYTKFPVSVANFILVKQVFGLTKERTNTNMQ